MVYNPQDAYTTAANDLKPAQEFANDKGERLQDGNCD